tara:strand:- start:232 stop:402 length:171 start_codon:yes stop_codon:yes gene_type:complete
MDNKQWDEINSRYNEHITSYIIFIMDKLEEHLTIKEVFDIIDNNGLEGLRNEYNKI